jgi:hypothetical protein
MSFADRCKQYSSERDTQIEDSQPYDLRTTEGLQTLAKRMNLANDPYLLEVPDPIHAEPNPVQTIPVYTGDDSIECSILKDIINRHKKGCKVCTHQISTHPVNRTIVKVSQTYGRPDPAMLLYDSS